MSGSVVLVDWLGRGGIAQCTDAWALELVDAGHDVVVVTRPGREARPDGFRTVGPDGGRGRVQAHRAVCGRAVDVIREQRPHSVVVQNYVLPPLERAVVAAAREVGARLVVVVHDHRLHTALAGTGWGLRRTLREADVVVAHTAYVADHVAARTGRSDVRVVPLPRLRGVLDGPRGTAPVVPAEGPDLALHFGVLKRGYKGAGTVAELARTGVPGWRFGFVGVGASKIDAGPAAAVDRFVTPDELVATVAASAATVLPYRMASQSGAVVLAQALGSVVVASAVGGIPDQVDDGTTGVLVPVGAGVARWREALVDLADPARRDAMARAAVARLDRDHAAFTAAVRELAA